MNVYTAPPVKPNEWAWTWAIVASAFLFFPLAIILWFHYSGLQRTYTQRLAAYYQQQYYYGHIAERQHTS